MLEKEFIFKTVTPRDAKLVKELMAKHWGGEPLIIRGQKYFPSSLSGMTAYKHETLAGFLFYEIQNRTCEIVVFEVFDKFKGIGTLFLEKIKKLAKEQNCNRLFLMTTNDNLDAMRFYQRRGFHICNIHLDTVQAARKIKPTIAETGDYGIPLRDEIDLELILE